MDETQHRIGNYTLVRALGEGGMGVVHLATDLRLGRPVALKMLRRELATSATDRDRFLREARAAAAVEHDNIVAIWDVDESVDGAPFIVMPLLKGESLEARLRREPVAPLDLVLVVAEDVASGLAAAHAAGLVHRDIKPANIWLEGDPGAPGLADQARRGKILDFGLARRAEPGDAQITASGVILGTPAYLAPEQARGERVDHRADLFSLGVVLYRMVTGRPPFKGDTPLSALVAVATDTPAPVRAANPNLPPDLADLIDRLLRKAPSARPQSAAEVARGVREIRARPNAASTSLPQLLPLAERSGADTVPEQPTRPSTNRGRTALAAASACVLALVPLAAWIAGAFDGKKPEETAAKQNGPQPPVEQGNLPDAPKPAVPEQKAAAADPDRKAALWVLSVGGSVHINGTGQEIKNTNQLPRAPFELTEVYLTTPVRDADLEALAGCKNLTGAYLVGTGITAEGLTHLKGCKKLTALNVSGTRVGDQAVPVIAGFTELADLSVILSAVTDRGVEQLAKALPGCRIQHDGGTTGPAKK